jgi:hypothetical protein
MATVKADIRAGESINLDGSGSARITLIAKSGQRARIEIEADASVSVRLPKTASVLDTIRGGLHPQKLADAL